MGQYNASPFQLPDRRFALLGAATISVAILAACATAPPAPAPAAAPVVATKAAPGVVEPLADTRAAAASAGSLSLREDAPLRYVVKKGDTLWDIAQHFLRDPWQWPELWYTNAQVSNPHRIHPGDVLTLVHDHDGRDLELDEAGAVLQGLASLWRGEVQLLTLESGRGCRLRAGSGAALKREEWPEALERCRVLATAAAA